MGATAERSLLIGRHAALVFLLGWSFGLLGQALPTASRVGDLQVGAGLVRGRPDYVPGSYDGVAIYADFDFRTHLGVEAEFHDVAGDQIAEQTYEVGGRYHLTLGPLVPYVKGMAGRGVFDYPGGLTKLRYTMYAGGGGLDVKVGEHLRVRGDYEYQGWSGFVNGGLSPRLVTIGVAYHFTGTRRTR
jgi:opacity protein-like surface antigen